MDEYYTHIKEASLNINVEEQQKENRGELHSLIIIYYPLKSDSVKNIIVQTRL